jgi:hypothetical protein
MYIHSTLSYKLLFFAGTFDGRRGIGEKRAKRIWPVFGASHRKFEFVLASESASTIGYHYHHCLDLTMKND